MICFVKRESQNRNNILSRVVMEPIFFKNRAMGSYDESESYFEEQQ